MSQNQSKNEESKKIKRKYKRASVDKIKKKRLKLEIHINPKILKTDKILLIQLNISRRPKENSVEKYERNNKS